MKLFEGLLLYEVVLLLLGVVLFIALVGILIYSVMRRRSIAPLLFFFMIPVVMIGFPAIQKVKFDKDGVEIEKEIKTIANQPAATPPAATSELKAKVDQYKARAANSPVALLTVARAEIALGEVTQSKTTIDQAIKLAPQSVLVQDFRSRVEKFNANTHTAILRDALKTDTAVVK